MPNDRPSTVSVHIPRFAVWALGVLLIAPWALFGIWLGTNRHAANPEAPDAHDHASANAGRPADEFAERMAQPGPWGDVHFSRIMLEPPEEFVTTDFTRDTIQPWIFKSFSDSELAALWKDAGLDAAQLNFVNDPAHRELGKDTVTFHVTRDFILSLSSGARAKIYSILGEFTENFAQYNPYRLRTTLASSWLDDSGVPDTAKELTRKLFYQRGTATCFSDQSIVLPLITEPAQRLKYVKALSRTSGLIAYLRVHAGENVDPLVAYWGIGGRSKDLKPLLQSLARRPNGGDIDIIHLLPRFARMLVYTYPLPSNRPIDANHDCHWTSFNFQNDEPDERLADINYVRQVLTDQYYPVPGAPQLGDIIMFVNQDGTVVHSCVYIADDIVFTKNGPAYSVPWLLSSLADVEAFYAATPDIQIQRYRAKHL